MKGILGAAFSAMWLFSCASQGGALTREQGEAILAELHDIKSMLKAQPPAAGPRTARIPDSGGQTLGSALAPLTMVEYTDYQCRFCKRYHDQTFPELRKNYVDTGKVRFVVRDLPLDMHPMARQAAIGARCAAAQGKFWEVHDAFFAAQDKLSPEEIRRIALVQGLDAVRYDACVASPGTAAAVDADVREATGAGIRGTPTFVLGPSSAGSIDGKIIGGAQPYETFAAAIDHLLGEQPPP